MQPKRDESQAIVPHGPTGASSSTAVQVFQDPRELSLDERLEQVRLQNFCQSVAEAA
jgi:hypothetical protein